MRYCYCYYYCCCCCCYLQAKLRRILQGPIVLTLPEVLLLLRDWVLEKLNVHRPLIMELMLWLMTRSLVGLLRSSGDFEMRRPSDGGGGATAAEVIFGFDSLTMLVHFGGIQGWKRFDLKLSSSSRDGLVMSFSLTDSSVGDVSTSPAYLKTRPGSLDRFLSILC